MKKLVSLASLSVVSASALLAVSCANGDRPYGLTGTASTPSSNHYVGFGPHGQPLTGTPTSVGETDTMPTQSDAARLPAAKLNGPHGNPM